MGKQFRSYKLPSGKYTSSAAVYQREWKKFAKPFAKGIGLEIGKAGASSIELQINRKKANNKKVLVQKVELPNWVMYRFNGQINAYNRHINELNKVIATLKETNTNLVAAKKTLKKVNDMLLPHAPQSVIDDIINDLNGHS